MTLIIKQVVIRGEVMEDSSKFQREEGISPETVKRMIEQAKREIERQCEEKISAMIDHSLTR